MTSPRSLDPCALPDLRHLQRLTDEFGIFQHTAEDRPRLEFGYAIDDVARALIVVTETTRLFPDDDTIVARSEERVRSLRALADLYLRFIEFCQRPDGRFHNFVAHDRTFQDVEGSLDSYGRTLWSLGVVWRSGSTELRDRAGSMLRSALSHVHTLPFVRSKAFTLLGLLSVLTTDDPLGVSAHVLHVTKDLLHAYADAASDDWPWFEDTLRYSNGALPYALLRVAKHAEVRRVNGKDIAESAREIGLRTLDFLLRVCTLDGVPAPIGNQGWYRAGGERARYDQQGVDAAAMVLAATQAWAVTKEPRYRAAAESWWGWFFGNNARQQSLYRANDGAVYDGLMEEGINRNRGAESVVSFLIAHLTLADAFCAERRTAGSL